MNVLVLGGSGFLSGHIAREAQAQGHSVWVLTRGQKPIASGLKSIQADRKDRPAFKAAIQQAGVSWDLVVDSIGFTAEDAQQDLDVFASCAKHLVFISSDCALSPHWRPYVIDETFNRFDTVPYGKNKRDAEVVLLCSKPVLPFTILRPNHIFGPGSQLGCLPYAFRDPDLLTKMKAGETLRLVGGGHFLIQPIFAPDLAKMVLSCAGNPDCIRQLYMAAGPDAVENRYYYKVIADVLGVDLKLAEAPISELLAAKPEQAGFCCHRVYSMEKARRDGLAVPSTRIEEALRQHVEWLLAQQK